MHCERLLFQTGLAAIPKKQPPKVNLATGIAVIPIQGVLTKKESWVSAFSGCSSYDLIGRYVQDAVNDDAVRAILFQVDSPGGETTGCLERRRPL